MSKPLTINYHIIIIGQALTVIVNKDTSAVVGILRRWRQKVGTVERKVLIVDIACVCSRLVPTAMETQRLNRRHCLCVF